jgi:PIN domain nuclease of toxin-antitoxin system
VNYLADTHILVWALNQPSRLSQAARTAVLDPDAEVFYSPVSLWEIAIKHGLGKMSLAGHTPEEFLETVQASLFRALPLESAQLASSYRLPRHHSDPFDRLLVWQAIQENLTLITSDKNLAVYQADGLTLLQ